MLEQDVAASTVAKVIVANTPLPPAPPGDLFSEEQWATLIAICEVYFPTLPTFGVAHEKAVAEIRPYLAPGVPDEAISKYLIEGLEEVGRVEFQESLRRRLSLYVPAGIVKQFAGLLAVLNTRLGSLALTGSTTVLQDQNIENRSKIVCNWSRSYLGALRNVFRALEMLTKLSWLAQTKYLHTVTGFPIVPEHEGEERNEGYAFKFHDFSAKPEYSLEFECDIAIVGSGCGAGVMASHLGRALKSSGMKIVVLEKGYHWPTSHFPMTMDKSGDNLMEGGGAMASEDGSISVLAGSTWGGGGTVNWSASLQPQHFVRQEWAEKDGLEFFQGGEFQDCLDHVCEKMGACKMNDEEGKSRIPQNFGNRMLLEGSRRLGLSCEVVPQNSGSKAHRCGYCAEGCASATKQGPANCWLPDAAENGVEFIEGCQVDEVIWDSRNSQRVAGLKVEWSSRDRRTTKALKIKAKRVIVSCGTMQSPALLIRSGITSRHVGRNLHLHPTMCIGTIWPDRVKPWEGPILTSAVTSYENVDGEGHGSKVELIAGTPGWMLPWNPWNPNITIGATGRGSGFASAFEYKISAAKYGHTAGFIAIQRDRDTGRIWLDPDDPTRRQIRFDYTPSERDRKGSLEGVLAGSKIAYAMGAKEIRPYDVRILPFVRSDTASLETNDAAFRLWCKEVRTIGLQTPEHCRFGSAHQMGTCRMSARKEDGVIDRNGRVWGKQGLYVADASTFPSASGVNPMVTVMGISEWIARGIVKEIEAEQA